MSGRVLFVDDSGKPAARDSTRAVVIGGFSVEVANVPVLSRRIVGAKGRFFPGRGHPTEWEIKAKRTIPRTLGNVGRTATSSQSWCASSDSLTARCTQQA